MQTFEKCGLDGAKMAGLNGATVKTTVRAVTQGEGWVQDVETVLIAMLSDESQADKTAAAESEDAKGPFPRFGFALALALLWLWLCFGLGSARPSPPAAKQRTRRSLSYAEVDDLRRPGPKVGPTHY